MKMIKIMIITLITMFIFSCKSKNTETQENINNREQSSVNNEVTKK